MSAEQDALYREAVKFAESRVGFSRRRFQEVLHVGSVKRDSLLLRLVDNGVIKHASNDRDYFLTEPPRFTVHQPITFRPISH